MVDRPLLKNTFLTSYFILMGYTIITLIESLRTPFVHVRNIMNVETTISVVAGIVYNMFIQMIDSGKVDLKRITELRYIDWSITTPLILLAILLFYNPDGPVRYEYFLALAVLDWGMLGAGYLGETGAISKWTGFGVGFAFLAGLLVLMYSCCIDRSANHTVFWLFAFIWSLYGVVYMIEDEETKNIGYNILDVLAKALFGVALWMYFGKVLKF